MKILITGGTGFLGRHLVWHFSQAGHEVVFTGRKAAEAQAVCLQAPQARFVPLEHGTGNAQSTLVREAAGADAIVHCAALASPWGPALAFRQANVDSTSEVLAACQANHVARLVHISSPSIYFEFRDHCGIDEYAALPAGVNEYARSKRVAEQLVVAADLPSRVILRPRAIFGPWDNTLLPRLLRLMQRGSMPLLRGGRALLDLTYVDNVVHAVQRALDLPPATEARIYNISNGEPMPAAELFQSIATHFHLPLKLKPRPYAVADLLARVLEACARLVPDWEPPITRYSLAAIAYSQTLSLERARSELGYAPVVGLEQGMARTAQWWLAREGRQ